MSCTRRTFLGAASGLVIGTRRRKASAVILYEEGIDSTMTGTTKPGR